MQCDVDVYRNGLLMYTEQIYDYTPASQSYPFAGWNFTLTGTYTKDLYLEISDQIEVVFRHNQVNVVTAPGDSSITAPGDEGEYDIQLSVSTTELDLSYVQEQIITGAEINIKSFLPKMDGATFFKGIVNMFNLYVQPDPLNNKNLIIEPLNTFYNGSNNAINWTHKLDSMQPIKVTPTINFSTQEYNLIFQDDKDYWNDRYTNDTGQLN